MSYYFRLTIVVVGLVNNGTTSIDKNINCNTTKIIEIHTYRIYYLYIYATTSKL